MIFTENNYKFMFAALAEAEKALDNDDIPVGAVVVKDDRIIGKGYNQVQLLHDPTAHAEMLAITAASNHLQSSNLTGCELYVSLEPCSMCAGALINARISKLFFSTFEPKYGACGSVFNLVESNAVNHKVEVYSGIYEEESKKLLKDFFESLRNHKDNL
ncbi:MAG: tRNA adenosine(34) deaminase TadA [Melioribacteraceae bacterium]|nr:tRNA adenosine(34) deaminase TadA [Melioribacteraceae bacterium]MCO6472405.1 tRNA adenosine(34) deaminase TadA [Melioribacteraceae bacterium]MDD3558682.1 tRNA adenosine(34) deaminase TadA [Melioribacteraceae bacterium]